MINRLVIIIFLVASLTCVAQTQSDVNVSEGGYGMIKTNITVNYDHTWNAVSDGFGARVSYQAYKNDWLTLSANFKHSSVTVDFEKDDLSDGYTPGNVSINGTHVMGQVGVTANVRTKLFGKPFFCIAMVGSDWGKSGFERVSATLMGMIMLRATRNTQFGIGPLVMVNSSSKIPAFLVFMYRHRFNDKLQLNLYGGMFGIEYNPTKNNLITAGADIDVKSFYFKAENERLPDICRFTMTAFRPMIKYRHRLAKNLYFDAQGGVSLKMSCRVNGKNGTKEYFDCKQSPSLFFQTGVSYSL